MAYDLDAETVGEDKEPVPADVSEAIRTLIRWAGDTPEREGLLETPERVARNILKAVEKNRAVAPIAAEAWALYYAKRLFPGLLARLARRARLRNREKLGLPVV